MTRCFDGDSRRCLCENVRGSGCISICFLSPFVRIVCTLYVMMQICHCCQILTYTHVLVFCFIHDILHAIRDNNNVFERQSGAMRLCLSNR